MNNIFSHNYILLVGSELGEAVAFSNTGRSVAVLVSGRGENSLMGAFVNYDALADMLWNGGVMFSMMEENTNTVFSDGMVIINRILRDGTEQVSGYSVGVDELTRAANVIKGWGQ